MHIDQTSEPDFTRGARGRTCGRVLTFLVCASPALGEKPKQHRRWTETRQLAQCKPTHTPVRPHARRLPSSERGVSLAFVRAFCRFVVKRGAVQLPMDDLCARPTLPVSLCHLTAHTGLSLVETLVLLAQRDGTDLSSLFGHATTYVTYAEHGTCLAEVGLFISG